MQRHGATAEDSRARPAPVWMGMRDRLFARSQPFFCTRQFRLPIGTAGLLCWSAIASAQSPRLLPPLPSEIGPNATYGELAPGSFHPGIDLPTGGERLDVGAAGDGEIMRVRVSRSGYGRALHLGLPDGREVVYAHMSRFAAAIEDSCARRQAAALSYDLDWTPAVGTFPVARGDILGATGETGDGRAILHLEVRIDGVPRNPLRSGFSWPDRIPPRIQAIRFVPLGPTARIDGQLGSEVIDADHLPGGLGAGRTVLWGPVGIECEACDEVGGQKCAPYAVRLDLDGVARSESDTGARPPDVGWDPGVPEPPSPQSIHQRLYRPSEGDRGRLLCGSTLRPGAHRLRIVARDAAGNIDSTSTTIVVAPNPQVEQWMARPLGRGDWDLAVRIGPEHEEAEETRLSVDLTEDGKRFPVHSLLGHIGDGWFVGQVSSLGAAGRTGLRIRLQSRDGIVTRGPVLSLDPIGTCAAAAIDSPLVRSTPRWIEIRVPVACLPSASPTASLQTARGTTACELLEDGETEGGGAWRFVAAAPARGAMGAPPHFVLKLDATSRRWRLPGTVLATPAEDLLWTSPDGALTVEIPAATFYAPVWLSWTETARQPGERIPRSEIPAGPGTGGSLDQDEVLIARSDAQAVAPADVELDAPFRVAIRPSRLPETAEEAKRLGVYGRAGSGPWRFLGGLWTGSAAVAIVDRLEEWIILEDRSEPWLYSLDPAPGERRIGSVASLSVQVREQGSGVTASSFEVELDGRRIPADWDPWARRLRATLPVSPGEGIHRWEVRARDAAGNAARRAATFTVTSQR